MNTLTILDSTDEKKWDNLVQSHELGQLYHTTAWKEIIESSFRHISANNLILYNTENQKICGGLPLYFVKSRLIGNRLISIPFGTLCDPLVKNSEQFNLLLGRISDLKEEYNCNSIELRVFKGLEFIDNGRLSVNCAHKHHYLYLNEGFKKIETKFKRTVRQSIRKAREAGLEVVEGKTIKDLNDFYKLYMITRKRNFLPSPPFRFFNNFWNKLNDLKLASLLLVWKDNRVIGGGIVIKFKDRATLEFLCSDSKFLFARPNHLLVYTAIKNTHAEGFRVFDFGRTHREDTGLLRFKKYWGTETVDLYQLNDKKSTGKSMERESLKLRYTKLAAGNAPLPLYRLLNSFCYRHHG